MFRGESIAQGAQAPSGLGRLRRAPTPVGQCGNDRLHVFRIGRVGGFHVEKPGSGGASTFQLVTKPPDLALPHRAVEDQLGFERPAFGLERGHDEFELRGGHPLHAVLGLDHRLDLDGNAAAPRRICNMSPSSNQFWRTSDQVMVSCVPRSAVYRANRSRFVMTASKSAPTRMASSVAGRDAVHRDRDVHVEAVEHPLDPLVPDGPVRGQAAERLGARAPPGGPRPGSAPESGMAHRPRSRPRRSVRGTARVVRRTVRHMRGEVARGATVATGSSRIGRRRTSRIPGCRCCEGRTGGCTASRASPT